MSIEKYWSDITIYYISFTINNERGKQKIDRLFAFESSINEQEIKKYIFTYFDNVESVEYIDYWDQGLLKNKNC